MTLELLGPAVDPGNRPSTDEEKKRYEKKVKKQEKEFNE